MRGVGPLNKGAGTPSRGMSEATLRGGVLNCNKSAAFTLAEVLITLAIIGVVAALTLPQLIADFRFNTVNNQRKAAASIVSDGFTRMLVNEDVDRFENTKIFNISINGGEAQNIENSRIIAPIIKENFDVIKNYEYCIRSACEPYDVSKIEINGGTVPFVLKNGMFLYLLPQGGMIDVNGIKGPNFQGYDVLTFKLEGSRVIMGITTDNGHSVLPSIGFWIFPSQAYVPKRFSDMEFQTKHVDHFDGYDVEKYTYNVFDLRGKI